MNVHQSPAPARLAEWVPLIRHDSGMELERALTSLLGQDSFWKNDWPRLCRQAVAQGAANCFHVLCAIEPDFGSAPLLPSDLLEKLHGRLLLGGPVFSRATLGAAGSKSIAERFAASPQRLRGATWESLARKGGWWAGHGMPCLHERLTEATWYNTALRAWLKTQRGRFALLGVLGAMNAPWDNWDEVLEQHWWALPAAHRSAFAETLGNRLCALDVQHSEQMFHNVRRAYAALQAVGIPVDGAPWREWFAARIREPWNVERVRVLLGLLRASTVPPSGLTWDCAVAEIWGKALGAMLLKTPEQTQVGLHPGHEAAHTGLFELERLLEGWGLQTPATVDALERGLSSVNPRWAEVVQIPTPNLRVWQGFEKALAQWKDRRLSSQMLPVPLSVTVRPRARM